MQGGGESAGNMYVTSCEQVGIMLSQCRRMRCVSAHRQHRRVNNKLNLGTSALDLPSYFDWKSDPPCQIRKTVQIMLIERKETTHLRQWHVWLA